MKNAFKISLGLAVILFVVLTSALSYIRIMKPELRNSSPVTLTHSAETVERGRYLSHHVAACFSCHSPRDWNQYSAPVIDSLRGSGGLFFGKREHLPGTYYARNITPSHTQAWTDLELYNSLATGLTADKRSLFPSMPYLVYGAMDSLDILAIAAYLRTLKPIDSKIIESESDFPMSLIIRLLPRSARHKKVDYTRAISLPEDSLKYTWSRGEYLTEFATCKRCHTQQEGGQSIPGLEYAGGVVQYLNNGDSLYSSNITPDKLTGIGNWTEKQFISRFKNHNDSVHLGHTTMPWSDYQGMSEQDLSDIYHFLQSNPPVKP
jgi:cytochrome c553